ncbi:fatty acid desaturase [Nodosilinea sp. E11]|uniref:fatty acid desaturase n=1 Tax=Nodosilinea sp. E11 TaxID=3037479 RepID=UPI0029347DD6|nr:fatty acid desaturase [Nodosilinea sp. E11]WOD37245.1 fatty acid desaturase [Nodosilinea sp. E11]
MIEDHSSRFHDAIFPDMYGNKFNIREKIWKMTEHFPLPIHRATQTYFDWLTGKPYDNQASPLQSNPWLELGLGFIEFFAGIIVWLWIDATVKDIPLILISWFLTISGIVQFREIAHHCAHNRFSESKPLNDFVGNLISIIVQITEFEEFQNYHNATHHSPEKLATIDQDPENLIYITEELGFVLGKSKSFYWHHLRQTVFSPRFHVRTLINRFKPNKKASVIQPRVISLLSYSLILMGMSYLTSWAFFAFWFVPIQVSFQVIALLQLLSEHVWGYEAHHNESPKSLLLGKCMSRFLGSVPPTEHFLEAPFSWFNWLLENVGYFMTRKLVLCLNLPVHSYHHAFPKNKNWVNETYDLQKFIDGGCQNWPRCFSEVWGLWTAIDVVFESLSSSSEDEVE